MLIGIFLFVGCFDGLLTQGSLPAVFEDNIYCRQEHIIIKYKIDLYNILVKIVLFNKIYLKMSGEKYTGRERERERGNEREERKMCVQGEHGFLQNKNAGSIFLTNFFSVTKQYFIITEYLF